MVTCATGGAFLPGRLITQLRQVPTLRFVWRSCITLGSGTTLACPMRSFSPNAVIVFMVRTILALAPQYLMGAFVSHSHTQPFSINLSSQWGWRVQRLSLVGVILPDIEAQLC